MSSITIRGLLALPILIPLAIGLWKYKIADKICRLFVLFLIIGFSIDLTSWILLGLGHTENLLTIFNIYSLIEAFFFFWFLQSTNSFRSVKSITKTLLYFTIPFWIICIFIYPELMPDEHPGSAVFVTTYEVIVSFLAGFALLQRVEVEKSIFSSSQFFLTFGIFFYCFCTFFIMGFLETKIVQKIWFINNIINITSYLFYAIGFWQIRSSQKIAS